MQKKSSILKKTYGFPLTFPFKENLRFKTFILYFYKIKGRDLKGIR